jgi:ferredoxin-type protein NapH
VTRAQAQLEPGALVLRYHRGYQRVRRLALTVSVLGIVCAPLWLLAADRSASAGLAGTGRWSRLAELLPSVTWADSIWLGAPWSLRIFEVEFIDPLAVASLLFAGVFPFRALLGVVPVLILMVGLGRFFCGWICPYVPVLAVSNATRSLLHRFGWTLPDVRLPRGIGRGVLLALLLATALSGNQWVPLIYPPSILAREVWRSIFQGSLSAGMAGVIGAFLFDTFISRAGFCRSICPGGALFSLLSARSKLVVLREVSKCTDCTACDVVCNLGQQPMSDRLDGGCERCGKCISVCPTRALRFDLKPSSVRIANKNESGGAS